MHLAGHAHFELLERKTADRKNLELHDTVPGGWNVSNANQYESSSHSSQNGVSFTKHASVYILGWVLFCVVVDFVTSNQELVDLVRLFMYVDGCGVYY